MRTNTEKPIPPHDRTPSPVAEGRAARRQKYASQTPEEIVRGMPAGELGRNARKGGKAAIVEQERRAAEGAATPVPLWMQGDIGSVGNYNPDKE